MDPLLIIAGAVFSLAAVAFLFLFAFTSYVVFQRAKYKHIPSPPLAGFLSGHTSLLLTSRSRGKPPIDYVALEWFQKLESDVIVLFAYHIVFVVVYGPEKTKLVLQSKIHPKPPELVNIVGFPCGERYAGRSLATIDYYEPWKIRRTLLNPVFHKTNLKSFVPKINDAVDCLLQKFQKLAREDAMVSLHKEFSTFALHVVANTIAGLELDFINGDLELADGLEKIGEMFALLAINPLFPYFPWNWKLIRDYKGRIRQLRETFRNAIVEKQMRYRAGERQDNDILTRLITCLEENELIDIEDIIDELVAFIIGGHETTASVLSFLLTEVASHPDVEERLLKEIRTVSKGQSRIEADDLPYLKYLGEVIKETLRLYTVIVNTQRKTSSEIWLGKFKIPKGTNIWVSLYSNCHDPNSWVRPDEFNPDRFEKQDIDVHPMMNTPFSGGPRSCIGQHLAQGCIAKGYPYQVEMEIKILTARFLKEFRFKLSPGQHGKSITNLVVSPIGGTKGQLVQRSKSIMDYNSNTD